MAANPSMTYTFVNATTASASEVNANFTTLVNWIAANAMQVDGSVAFTSIPSGPASDPTTANQFARKAYVDAASSVVGSIIMYGGAAAPTGWMLCQGQEVSRATYSSLYAVVGTTYGVGDGSTTFNLPDLRGRSPLGAGTGSGLTARTLGANVGEETHLLTGAESGTSVHNHTQDSHNHGQSSHNHTQDAHNHTQASHNHSITQTYGAYGYAGGTRNTLTASGDTSLTVSSATPSINTTVATNQAATATNIAATATNQATAAANASSAHNNMSPALVLNYIIKY